jgi:tetratricopeptide (TPR) repeat protein/predicted GH43/DUF377 family glycosyl hydrolase
MSEQVNVRERLLLSHWNLGFEFYLLSGICCLMLNLFFIIPLHSISQATWHKYPGNPVFQPGKAGEWDMAKIAHTVLYVDGQYKMWYKGWSDLVPGFIGVGYASSPDGIHWQKYEANPLEVKCEGTSWDTVFDSFDIIKKDSLYLMWYAGIDKKTGMWNVGYAWSENGLSWTKLPEPVMEPGKDNAWDAAGIKGASVYFDGTRYHMWYNGNDTISWIGKIGYATSGDGIHWEKHPANPVLDVGGPGTWDEYWIDVYSVNFNGDYYEMWYDGFDKINTQTGYATSVDGVRWIKSPDNPVLRVGNLGYWDTWIARIPTVLSHDSVYKMWYYGHDYSRGNIGYATTSVDEARAWESATINKPQTKVKVKILNRTEYINVDSLAGILPGLQGIELANACNKLALAYSLSDNKKSLEFAERALEISDKQDYPGGRAMALYSIGNCQYIMDNYSEALASQLSALWLFDSLDMHFEHGNLLAQIAGIHSYAGSHDLACRYYQQALDVFQQLNDTDYIVNSTMFLGFSYLNYGDTISALKLFKSGLSKTNAIQDDWIRGWCYESIGLCYSGHNLDSALFYFSKANKIWNHAYPEKVTLLYTAEAYLSAGPEYYQEAEKYFNKCFPLMANDKYHKVRLYLDAAELYFLTGRHNKSKESLDISLDECQRLLDRQDYTMFASLNEKLVVEIDLKRYMEKIYRLNYRIDTALHHKDSAFTHFILASQWKDSIYNEQNRRKTAMMQGTYETESTQNRMGMLQKANEVKDLQIKQTRIYLYGLAGFIIIIIFIALLFIRQNKIKAEHQKVILEQKLLRLQMNPHFIFNALSNILNFINRKDTDNAANYLNSFSRLLRTTLESSREDYILLSDEIQSLKNYLDLQLLRYAGKFEYSLEVDEEIDIENAIIPPILIQPFIENAIEHGIRHKQGIGHIYIRFRLEDKKVICEVEDDGVGREKAWETEYQERKTHKSLATEIITDRIQSLNNKLKQKIKLNIIDLKSDDNESSGTKVILNLPYLID